MFAAVRTVAADFGEYRFISALLRTLRWRKLKILKARWSRWASVALLVDSCGLKPRYSSRVLWVLRILVEPLEVWDGEPWFQRMSTGCFTLHLQHHVSSNTQTELVKPKHLNKHPPNPKSSPDQINKLRCCTLWNCPEKPHWWAERTNVNEEELSRNSWHQLGVWTCWSVLVWHLHL